MSGGVSYLLIPIEHKINCHKLYPLLNKGFHTEMLSLRTLYHGWLPFERKCNWILMFRSVSCSRWCELAKHFNCLVISVYDYTIGISTGLCNAM